LGGSDQSWAILGGLWPAAIRRAGIEDVRDVRMVHRRERLLLGLKAGNDTFAVMSPPGVADEMAKDSLAMPASAVDLDAAAALAEIAVSPGAS
jgi:hypothetical protein